LRQQRQVTLAVRLTLLVSDAGLNKHLAGRGSGVTWLGHSMLAEACWARRVNDRPSMAQVLQALLDMLAAAEQQQVQGY
jgi:hypothetical protein